MSSRGADGKAAELAVYACLHQTALAFETACRGYLDSSGATTLGNCDDSLSIGQPADKMVAMKLELSRIASILNLLQLRKALLYVSAATDFLRVLAGDSSRNALETAGPPAADHLLARVAVSLNVCTALLCMGRQAADPGLEPIIGLDCVNQLRGFCRKRPLPGARCDQRPALPLAMLAACAIDSAPNALDAAVRRSFCQDLWTAEDQQQAVASAARLALLTMMEDELAQLWKKLPDGSQLTPQQLYALASLCHRLQQLAATLDLQQSGALAAKLEECLWRRLRWPELTPRRSTRQQQAPDDSLLHALPALLLLAAELEISGDKQACRRLCQSRELAAALTRQEADFLEWQSGFLVQDPAIYLSGEIEEAVQTLGSCLGQWQDSSRHHYISPDLCISLRTCSLNLQLLGRIHVSEFVDSAAALCSASMRCQRRVGSALTVVLSRVLECLQVLPSSENIASFGASSAYCADRDLTGELLRLECRGAAVATQVDGQGSEDWSLKLAGELRLLIAADAELEALTAQPAPLQEDLRRWVASVSSELRLLSSGAHALGVFRIEALSSAMLDVYQSIMASDSSALSPRSHVLLRRAHRILKKMLNQAAAHQEVSSARTVIAALYQWLEGRPQGRDVEAIFRAEAASLLDGITQMSEQLLAHTGEAAAQLRQRDRDAILRQLHTLKGAAAALKRPALAQACHQAEAFFLQLQVDTPASPKVLSSVRASLLALEQAAELPMRSSAGRLPAATITLEPGALGRWIQQAHACQLAQQRIIHMLKQQRGGSPAASLTELAAAQAERLASLESQLQEARLSCLAALAPRLERVTAQTANALERHVRLRLEGSELLLHQELAAHLQPCLEHLLRNAVVHGVEPPEQRRAVGKPEVAELVVEARRRGSVLIISVLDDGAGIDHHRLLQRALQLGIPEAESAPEVQRLSWLFMPGFTTQTSPDLHAGRGLGLDVVQQAVQAVGGRVRVRSTPGRGSRFRLILPDEVGP